MRYINIEQIEEIKNNVAANSTEPERDLLLIKMSVEMGIKPVHLSAMRVNDMLQSNGEIIHNINQTPVPEHIRKDIANYLQNRFKIDHKSLRSVSLHFFTNRENRGHYTDQSMAVHLTFLIRRSGINATATCLRNSFIRSCAIKGNAAELVKLTRVKNPATVIRYLFSEYEEVNAILI